MKKIKASEYITDFDWSKNWLQIKQMTEGGKFTGQTVVLKSKNDYDKHFPNDIEIYDIHPGYIFSDKINPIIASTNDPVNGKEAVNAPDKKMLYSYAKRTKMTGHDPDLVALIFYAESNQKATEKLVSIVGAEASAGYTLRCVLY